MTRQEAATTDDCKLPPKLVRPVIDPHRCEGAGDCEDVCPYGVFELRKLTRPELKALPLIPWLKVVAHGGKQAFAIDPDACHACGRCVQVCPEKAIRLSREEQRA